MLAFGQGYASLNAPTKRIVLVLSGQLTHGGNPVLRALAYETRFAPGTIAGRYTVAK